MSKIDPSPNPVAEAVPGPSAPLLLDLGKQKRKAVKQLRKGKGKLLADVLSTIEELKTLGTISHTVQPVIVELQQDVEEASASLGATRTRSRLMASRNVPGNTGTATGRLPVQRATQSRVTRSQGSIAA